VTPALDISEAEWQEQVIDLAHKLGWRHMHVRRSIGKGRRWTTATNVDGWPDLFLWSEKHHRSLFVELKSETGKLSPEQVTVLDSLTAGGAECHVWRPSHLHRVGQRLSGHHVVSTLWGERLAFVEDDPAPSVRCLP
jgi:hypothetical protein